MVDINLKKKIGENKKHLSKNTMTVQICHKEKSFVYSSLNVGYLL